MAAGSTTTVTGCAVTVAAVLFDLDGVLVDSTPSVERLWRDFADAHGLDAEQLLHDLHGRRMLDIMAAAVPHLSPDELAREAACFDAAEVADAERAEALPGARELTRELTQRRVPWAVVTSGTDAVSAARIAAVGLDTPDVLVTADRVTVGKPDPEPYVTAAHDLGVGPRHCLVVEDAPSGVRAGNAAGAITVAVASSHTPAALAHAHHQIVDLRDIGLVRGSEPPMHLSLTCSRHGRA